jgi:hypothetical protein
MSDRIPTHDAPAVVPQDGPAAHEPAGISFTQAVSPSDGFISSVSKAAQAVTDAFLNIPKLWEVDPQAEAQKNACITARIKALGIPGQEAACEPGAITYVSGDYPVSVYVPKL